MVVGLIGERYGVGSPRRSPTGLRQAMKPPLPRRRLVAAVLTVVLGGSDLVPMSAAAPEHGRDPRQALAEFRHQKRVLLVLAPSAGDSTYQTQVRLWADQQAGFTERDLVKLPVFSDLKERDALAREYGAKPGAFAVVLIGKDGHAAFATDHPVAAAEIFEKIDAMPMRRAEMRRKN